MDGLKMKYFILKPEGDGTHEKASRVAIMVYADEMEVENPVLADELRAWVNSLAKPDELPSEELNNLLDRIMENLASINERFLHNHPIGERRVNLEENHVIIDREDWEKSKNIINDLRLWTSMK